MTDLISRQAAVDALGDAHFKNYGNAILVIKDLPSAEPVRHGKWIDDAMEVLRCSECRTQAPWKYGRDYIDYRWKANYCPNCGARMDEE